VSKVAISKSSALQQIPEEIHFFLNDPPLWAGESRADYMALLAAIGASCLAGHDVVKWLLVNEMTHQIWEIRRFMRIEASLVLKRQAEVIKEVLQTTYYDSETEGMDIVFFAGTHAHAWEEGGELAKKTELLLAERGYDMETIRVRAYERCAAELREIENAIAKRENRRRATLLDIERRDEAFAKRLAQASMEVLDAEFSEAAE
jgi:hypothetical protein